MFRIVVNVDGAEFEAPESPFEEQERAWRCAEALMRVYARTVTRPPRIRILNTDSGQETTLRAEDSGAK